MIALTLVALLQFGSCQASPDRSRTPEEAADLFMRGIEEREPRVLQWVVRRDALFEVDGQTYSDAEFYDLLETDTSIRKNLVILSITSTPATVAVTTVYSGAPEARTLTVMNFSDGCITAVAVHH